MDCKLKALVIACIFLLGLTNCKSRKHESKDDPRPAFVIPDSIMVPMLVELHLNETTVQEFVKNNEARPYYYHYNKKQVLKEFDIDSARFSKTIDWYHDNPKKYEWMYESVLEYADSLEAVYLGDSDSNQRKIEALKNKKNE